MIKDWLVPLFGIALATFGCVLTWQGNKEVAQAEILQHIAEKTTLEAVLQKVVFFDNPAFSKTEFESFSASKVQRILSATYGDLNSQMQNQYLASDSSCYKSWNKFRGFLVIAMADQEVFKLFGPEHSIEVNYYAGIDSLAGNCVSL